MDLYLEIEHYHSNPIVVISEGVFAIKDDGLELVIEFIELEQYIGTDGFMMRPKFSLISVEIIEDASDEQISRYSNQE